MSPVLAVVICAPLVVGCAAGQRAQTAEEVSVVDGASADISTIGLRNVGVAPPSSGPSYAQASTADLRFDLVNNGQAADALVSVSSPAATSVVITAPTGALPVSSAATAVPTPTATGTASGAATGSVIEVGASQLVHVDATNGSGVVALTSLAHPLISGQTIPVTFTFRSAGTVTVAVPVKLQPGQTGGLTVAVSPTGD